VIIEGGKHGSGQNLGRYLLRPGTNAELVEIRGSTGDLAQTLTDWETVARTLSKGQRVLYHAYARIPENERLTAQQWHQLAAQLEQNLGLEDCPRALVMHDETSSGGRKGKHLHMVWSRLRPDETLAPLHHDRRQFHITARWAEETFNLTPIAARPKRSKTIRDRDIKALKGRNMPADQLQKILLKAWNSTTDGHGFRQALDDHEILLLKGDRRDYVIDVEGFKMNPVRLMPGVNAAEFRARLEGLDMLRETPEAQQVRGRKARQLARDQIDRHLANDEQNKPPKRGWRKVRQIEP
jgi:hypothetical protein